MYTPGYSCHIQNTGYDRSKQTEKDGLVKSLTLVALIVSFICFFLDNLS